MKLIVVEKNEPIARPASCQKPWAAPRTAVEKSSVINDPIGGNYAPREAALKAPAERKGGKGVSARTERRPGNGEGGILQS
jgi:hypothetical protein